MNEASGGQSHSQTRILAATLGALGIVFGDIGTSPLYAFRECFYGSHAVPVNPANLEGAASLIVWSLLLVVTVKYLFVILRLDNKGEGGILALSALIRSAARRLGGADPRKVLLFGLAGAALIYADGMLTPAISVLSAVEGLTSVKGLPVNPEVIKEWIVPLSVVILAGLFAIQRHGTGRVGALFGPVVLMWFGSVAALGIYGICQNPKVIIALNPLTGLEFIFHNWKHAFPLLAAVFLAVTGGEALYADLGHFGTKPIRLGWFSVVLPALVLNYLGQAAFLSQHLDNPEAKENPFFQMAPEILRLPLTLLATGAAVIASQALISGAFSLTTQAVQLGCLPRVRILHTSEHSAGQVFVPAVNRVLAIACILLVIAFKDSASLAGAYGIAIALTMTITSVLFYSASRSVWGWENWKAMTVTVLFLIIDGAFLAANGLKIIHGGWLPLVVATAVMIIMMTWLWGRARLYARLTRDSLPVDVLLHDLKKGSIHRVSGTAVYMSGRGDTVPVALLHNLKHNQVLHERVVLLHVDTLDEPHSNPAEAAEHVELGEGLHRVTLRFGFADTPDVPDALKTRLVDSCRFQPGKATYFLGRETYGVGKKAGYLDRVRLALFAGMARNASPATAYFRLPPGRVVELGAHITL